MKNDLQHIKIEDNSKTNVHGNSDGLRNYKASIALRRRVIKMYENRLSENYTTYCSTHSLDELRDLVKSLASAKSLNQRLEEMLGIVTTNPWLVENVLEVKLLDSNCRADLIFVKKAMQSLQAYQMEQPRSRQSYRQEI